MLGNKSKLTKIKVFFTYSYIFHILFKVAEYVSHVGKMIILKTIVKPIKTWIPKFLKLQWFSNFFIEIQNYKFTNVLIAKFENQKSWTYIGAGQ